MGQAWCKDKSTKAQDSKSPLDRVFVRCAHRIYPGLKEEGSVLGSATQRVTSSEIGYAGSPPRAALLRGRSIDSVDRPFHPSEWVDVNLEVPCTPRASVILSGHRRLDLPKPSGPRGPGVATLAPVPPPRRRRRRERRPLPPKPGSGDEAAAAAAAADDDESEHEPEPLYSKLTSTIACKAPEDSDEEFTAIELILQKHSLEDIRPSEKANSRPKNHSTTSLPNVVELLQAPKTFPEDAAARRPPRHVKTGSLPSDASLFAAQTPERTIFARRIVEDRAEDAPTGDNSIRNDEAEFSLEFGVGLETSTPVKVREQLSIQELDDNSENFQDESSESRVSSSPSAEASVAREPSRRDEDVGYESRRDEDVGYESRTDSHPFSDASVGGIFHASDELSSGILRDAMVDSFEKSESSHVLVIAAVQRTISEESLPREMLVDELDEDDEQPEQMQHHLDDESSTKDTSNEISSNGFRDLDTPSPSPIFKCQALPSDAIDSHESRDESHTRETSTAAAIGNETSMTSKLIELEVAHTDMLLEKKVEREREASEDKSSDKLPEPQIVPLKRGRSLEDVEGHPPILSYPRPRTAETEDQQPSKSRLIDFSRADRPNPFNDLKSDDLEPPEKPSRLHRINLMEESVIEEPLLVPTPPRRRHRSKSTLNSSTESNEPLHSYAVGNDRLI